MNPRWTGKHSGSVVFEADAREVAATLPAGSCSLAILDGPYGMGKAAWDRVPRGGSLLDIYRGHFDDVGRLCAPSASLYVWNTSAGWAELHADLVARGWVFRSLIVWSKPDGCARKSAHEDGARAWPETMEVCGFYQREAWAPSTCAGQEVAYAAGRDERNWIQPWLRSEWYDHAGLSTDDARIAIGCRPGSGMPSHYFTPSQWALPTWEAYQQLAAYAAQHGPPRERPYLVHPSRWPGDLRASYDHLRAEYEASRPPFTCPLGVGNVWTHNQVIGAERLRAPDGAILHPCQKPLLFADRMLRASSRPGDTVWVPFGGTCREVVAAEQMARREPAEARRVVCCELNQDGVDYLTPALAQADGLAGNSAPGQVGLFGGAP